MTTSPIWRGTPSESSSRPSIGNESTSGVSSTPRCSRLSARASSALTQSRPSSPSSTPSARSTRRASSATAPSSTAIPLRFATSTSTIELPPPCGAGFLRVGLVGLHDPLHELVPHDILVAEPDEGDPVDRPEDVLHLDQARGLLLREVDLGHVAGDDDLGAEAEPREEHLHLLGTRVLRLVEDDERVVQRPAAHEGERRDLDDAALRVRIQPVGLEHVVERVVQRTQVRVDLREDVARQEPEPLAGLDGRACQDDPVDLTLLESSDGERHRQVRLAGSSRADRERDRVLSDRVYVALLHHRLGRDPPPSVAPDDVLEDLADVLALVDRAEHGVDC